MAHERFHYRNLDDINARANELHIKLPLERDLSPLFEPIAVGGNQVKNRIAFQPMEGSDGTTSGAPGALTCRRYKRFASGGPGIIWFEAVSTTERGRASSHQLYLTLENVDAFKRLLDDIREESMQKNGYAPLVIMQATNSGRYAKPQDVPAPYIAYNCPPLEAEALDKSCIVSDDELQRFEDAFAQSAKLAQLAGFDGMDVKACHRYLSSELLSAYTRDGKYGGSYENRTRFLKNEFRAARSVIQGDFFLTSRLNVYDGFAYPYGFGVKKDSLEPDLTEAIRLIGELREEFDIPLINVTMGNPYKNPHINRPYDKGNYIPDEHPLVGVARMMEGVRGIQEAFPSLPVMGSAFSYLRQFSPNMAAAMVKEKACAIAGFGRLAFANPDFVREIKETGCIDKRHVCVTCGGCAQLLRAGKKAGCIIRDREVYQL